MKFILFAQHQNPKKLLLFWNLFRKSIDFFGIIDCHILRNELKTSQKIFFYDCGIRNALISDFRPVDLRPDIGGLFENYIIAELKKRFPNENTYFWRTKNQQEVDCLIEKDGEITAIEVKWNERKIAKLPNTFIEAYHPKHSFTIKRENYLQILTDGSLGYLEK